LVLFPALILGLGLIPAGRLTAQSLTTLHGFTATDPNTGANTDGANPQAGLVVSGNTLYGTAAAGGSSGNGTVFALSTNGTGFTNLYSFTAFLVGYITNSDGAFPYAGLILSGNTLYGTAEAGGRSGNGTVFRVNTNGLDFTNLYSFTATSGSEGFFGNGTNSDGANPQAGLILSGNTLYGTAGQGGSGGNGTVFRINTDGTGFTNLYSFTAFPAGNFNSDGAFPSAGLILSGNTLYGTAQYGGSSANGTVFKINTDGTGFTNLYSFDSSPNDGADPQADLILSGNTLYGTTEKGGSAFSGTVFGINTNGTGFTTLYSFTAFPVGYFTNSDGAFPYAGLILSGNTLYVYGTAEAGGRSGNGTVFSLIIPPQLTIIRSGTNVTLTWPTNATGFTLEFATNLVSPIFWNTNSPAPVVINRQNTVTNPISGTHQFFRLSNP